MNWRDIKWELTFIAVVVFVVPPALWVYRDVTTARQLEAKLAALRAQGMPVTMTEAAPEPVSDDQNAAVLYQQVFQVQFGPGSSYGSRRRIGGLTGAEEQVLERYREQPNEQTAAQARQILARPAVQRDLETLRRASRRPHSVFPVRWEEGYATVFPHYARLRSATRMIALQTALTANEGDIEEALDWCEVALRMSEHAASEPTLIAQLVAIAMQAITFAPMKQFLAEASVPPATANRFEQYLQEIDMYESFTGAMIGERAGGCDAFDMAYGQPLDSRHLLSGYGVTDMPGPLEALYFSPLGRPLQRMDQLIYLEHMGKVIEVTELSGRTAKPKLAALEADLDKLPPWQGMFTKILCSIYSRVCQKRDQAVAEIDLCRIVLALKAYKYERGRYPDSLQQLQQTLDWQLPQDPFSGQGFVYQRQADGFKLYSIGQDLEDDSGIPEGKPPQNLPWGEADIVWEGVS